MEQRAAFPDPQQEAGVDLGRLGGPLSDLDGKAGRRQPCVPLPLHPRIGILERRHDALDARRHQRVHTGRRAAVMRTGFQGDIGRGALQRLTGLRGLGDRIGFGVRAAAVPGAAARQHLARTQGGASFDMEALRHGSSRSGHQESLLEALDFGVVKEPEPGDVSHRNDGIVLFRDDIEITPAIAGQLEGADERVRRRFLGGFDFDAIQRRLHGAGGDGEGLEEKRADA